MSILQQETSTQNQHRHFGRHPLPERQSTSIENAQMRAIREMVKQLVLARECRNQGDSDGYAQSYCKARMIADEAKSQIEQLFEIYCAELFENRP